MNKLIEEAVKLLKGQNFEFAICGGFAIDLFLGYESRKHGDIDILAYWNDRNSIILHMQSKGYCVYEMLGGGMAHHITDVNNQQYEKRNIFCSTNDCELVHLAPTDKKDIYIIDFYHIGQTKMNFIEFLFNDKDEKNFLYARNKNIKRELSKAILHSGDISYLAPELLLLYKSTDIEREGYQEDFEFAFSKMSNEQKVWLNNSLKIMYPDGHKWMMES
ncbi:nucleotidyltransferase domain-containing protein [Anaerocolumna xylanovorans]|uniref:Aminoglycoside-2''-adenylyltransferase n=1 Tax=Anaerocolumna xylanovorans DSM 12503 TaxID=1121345 RepID=A0A1M7Y1Z8_9FIRM|nr:hypothetical protein [Anaerocolumna xylanovorans]SHO45636.1 hypothetical protein SAMN02745217_01022 [Anaerocolumna xylanovorans DSM 12503]